MNVDRSSLALVAQKPSVLFRMLVVLTWRWLPGVGRSQFASVGFGGRFGAALDV